MGNFNTVSLAITLGLGFCLTGVLLRRRLHREFPFFLAYVAATTIGDVIKAAVVHDYATYFYVYWSFEVLSAVLALAALYEAYYRVFHNFFRVFPWFWTLFPSAVALVVVVSTYYAVTRPPVQAVRIISLIISLEIGVNLIQACIFLLFRGAMLFFRARRRNYPLGIVDGFAVVAAAGLMYGLRSEFGTRFAFLVQYGVPVAYILALAVWLDTFLRPPESRPQLPQGMTLEQALADMAKGTEELKDLSRRLER
jgi:hypothetical protein